VLLLDAGHGGSDPGASGNGLTEKNLTLTIMQIIWTAAALRFM
jgi:N-acetylmuramoyl-L-alanine amidase